MAGLAFKYDFSSPVLTSGVTAGQRRWIRVFTHFSFWTLAENPTLLRWKRGAQSSALHAAGCRMRCGEKSGSGPGLPTSPPSGPTIVAPTQPKP